MIIIKGHKIILEAMIQ